MPFNWKKTHLYLFTWGRYFLGTVILMYAMGKLLGTQFSSQPSVYDRPIGSLSGFELTWFYYGYSRWYGVFLAASQITAAGLLFFRRTTRLGIVLYLAIMANIVAVDFAYDIQGAKGMALVLTAVALFVFGSEWRLFFHYFLAAPPLYTATNRPAWLNKVSWVKFLYIPAVCAGFWVAGTWLKSKYLVQNELHGTWQITLGQPQWNRLHFEAANTFSLYQPGSTTAFARGTYRFDAAQRHLSLLAFRPAYLQKASIIDPLHPDTTQMTIFFAGRYELNGRQLRLRQANQTFVFTRVR